MQGASISLARPMAVRPFVLGVLEPVELSLPELSLPNSDRTMTALFGLGRIGRRVDIVNNASIPPR